MTEDIRDIRGPVIDAASSAWWPYALGIAALAAVSVMIVLLVQRRRRRRLSADELALRELAETRALIDRGDTHAFSVRVSAAVRGFVEQAFAIHAPRRTTEELLADLLHAMSPVAPYRAELGEFLETCDLAKYARWSLSTTEMTRMVDSAERFVRALATPKGQP